MLKSDGGFLIRLASKWDDADAVVRTLLDKLFHYGARYFVAGYRASIVVEVCNFHGV